MMMMIMIMMMVMMMMAMKVLYLTGLKGIQSLNILRPRIRRQGEG